MARVLIVDDNKQSIHMMSTVLSYLGHEVLGMMDGESGLLAATEDRPDLVLLDFMMPGRDGLEVLQDFRGTPGLDKLPIFILTASHDQFLQERVMLAGATGFLTKPIKIEELESIIAQHMAEIPIAVAA